QAHRRDAPTAPAFGELARADQYIESAVLVVQGAKQRTAEVVAFTIEGIGALRQTEELCIIANINQAEGLCIAHAQRQLALAALDVEQFQSLVRRGGEKAQHDVRVGFIQLPGKPNQGREAPAEDIVALGIQNLR